MLTYDELNAQNDEITELTNVLNLLLTDRLLCDSHVTAELFCRLVERVRDHMEITDKKIYTQLLVSGNEHISTMANRFMGGSKEIKRIFSEFVRQWCDMKKQQLMVTDYEEFASITNEMLLASSLRGKTEDRDIVAYLIDSQINDFRTTLFRQTMFAEFELLIHRQVEQGESLSSDWLNNTYMNLVKLYHGDAFEYDAEDSLIQTEWARIPHFYYNFYVYKYATGLASAASISSSIINGEEGTIDRYINFLCVKIGYIFQNNIHFSGFFSYSDHF